MLEQEYDSCHRVVKATMSAKVYISRLKGFNNNSMKHSIICATWIKRLWKENGYLVVVSKFLVASTYLLVRFTEGLQED